jgi:hypothetical protein
MAWSGKSEEADGDLNISDVCTAGVDKDDYAGYWERPSLIFFREKNYSAEAEPLASLTWRREYWNGGAMSSMATIVFGGFVSGSGGLAEKDEQGGKEG